jgi:predicted regulator of Ras-like GTPase activity (Roadblock/LC7/MglB family)
MTSDTPKTAAAPRNLNWVLAGFIKNTPGVLSAVLTAGDGMQRAFEGLDQVEAEHLSAIASGLFSLGKQLGGLVGDPENGTVRQVVVEHDAALLFVCQAGDNTVLAVTARREADRSQIGYDIGHLIKQVNSHLATPARGDHSPHAAQ